MTCTVDSDSPIQFDILKHLNVSRTTEQAQAGGYVLIYKIEPSIALKMDIPKFHSSQSINIY